jgi:hypothetical protein
MQGSFLDPPQALQSRIGLARMPGQDDSHCDLLEHGSRLNRRWWFILNAKLFLFLHLYPPCSFLINNGMERFSEFVVPGYSRDFA